MQDFGGILKVGQIVCCSFGAKGGGGADWKSVFVAAKMLKTL